MAKERNLEDALQSMNELINMQQKALETADDLLKIKNQQVAIADRLIDIYKKENKVLKICFYSLVALHILSLLIRFL